MFGTKKIKGLNVESDYLYDLGDKWITANKKSGMESPQAQRLLGELEAKFEQAEQIGVDNLDVTHGEAADKTEIIRGQVDKVDAKYDAVLQRMDEVLGLQSEPDEDAEKLLAEIMQDRTK